jgi:hypothetical protein
MDQDPVRGRQSRKLDIMHVDMITQQADSSGPSDWGFIPSRSTRNFLFIATSRMALAHKASYEEGVIGCYLGIRMARM